MADKIKLEVVAPDAVVVSDEVDEISAVGVLGNFGVLPGHCQMLTSLGIGELSYTRNGKVSYIAVGGGYAEVGPEKVTILAETAEPAESIDVERANSALKKAQDALRSLAPDDSKAKELEQAIEKATLRLEIAKKR